MRTLALCVALACSSVSCGSPPPLTNTYPSADALAGAILDALTDRDRQRLEGLALSEAEFRAHVWPELPASRPERNLPFSYVWGDLRQKSELGLSRTIAARGGKRYTLVGTRFSGETTYPHFTVHREASVIARDGIGTEAVLRVCGSMIEKAGAWKVFSYVVDD